MEFFEKEAKIKIPNFVKSYSPVIGLGAIGAGTGAAVGGREDSSFSPLKGAIGGGLIGAAYGGVAKKGWNDMKKATQDFDDAFKGYGDFGGSFKGDFGGFKGGYGGSGSVARKTVDLGADLKNLHLNKGKIKTKKEVKKQYRDMARRYHPDVNPKGEEQFKRIAGSWENIQGTSWYEKLAKLKKENYKMKYFDKNAAFDPKRLVGPAVGAAALGTLGYATAEKEDKMTAGITSGILGGVVGLAFKGKGGPITKGPKRKSFFDDMAAKMNPLDETEKVLEKSREEMKKVDSMRSAIKTHTTTKGEFKYKDALKMTKEKRAAFLAEMTKLAKASKGEAATYTGASAGAGAYGGLRAGEAFGKAHAKVIAEDPFHRLKSTVKGYYGESPSQYAAKVSKRVKRFGAVAGGALGAGAAANYFLRKNI